MGDMSFEGGNPGVNGTIWSCCKGEGRRRDEFYVQVDMCIVPAEVAAREERDMFYKGW